VSPEKSIMTLAREPHYFFKNSTNLLKNDYKCALKKFRPITSSLRLFILSFETAGQHAEKS
jgi:hypothetical protein